MLIVLLLEMVLLVVAVVVAVVFVAVVVFGVVAVSGVIVGGGDSCNSHDNRIIENIDIGNVNYLCRCLRYILPSLLAALVVNGSRRVLMNNYHYDHQNMDSDHHWIYQCKKNHQGKDQYDQRDAQVL